MKRMVGLCVIAAVAGCGGDKKQAPPASSAPNPIATEGLVAFARLHGAVRWFHPSDEAAALDWDRYAIAGVHEVRTATTTDELRRALTAWVAPIGPTVQILGPGELAAPRAVDATLPQVAWQYRGPGFDGGQPYTYLARRTNRTGTTSAATWSPIIQAVDGKPLRGKKMRLRGQLKAGPHAHVALWLRVDRPGQQLGFFNNMSDREVSSPVWTAATIEGVVDADAEHVVFGGLVHGADGWFDGFALEIDDGHGGWTPVALTNPDFTSDTTGWRVGNPAGGYLVAAVPGARDGGAAAHLTVSVQTLTTDLFPERPAADEVVDVPLALGLHAIVPLSLASPGDHTVPAGDLAAAQAKVDAVASIAPTDLDVRIADVVVAWGALASFYPYHDVIATRWDDALPTQLGWALAEASPADHATTLGRLIAQLEDGHGKVMPDTRLLLPVALALVEGHLVALASAVPEVQRGDVVVAIDGEDAAAVLARERALTSGSPQWRDFVAGRRAGSGPAGSVRLRLERDGATREATVTRVAGKPPSARAYPPVGEARPGVWLVDLERATEHEIDAALPAIATAHGVVFDLRGYPNGTHGVLRHLLPAPEHALWMHVAHVIRPGGVATGWDDLGWHMTPARPHIEGRAVFITGGGAISYAESVMGYVEAMALPVVGGPSAGTNGNVRAIELPSGAGLRFTGMKVTRHDGTRSHLEGIRPTIPIEPTLAGIRAGRDEVLERALDEAAR